MQIGAKYQAKDNVKSSFIPMAENQFAKPRLLSYMTFKNLKKHYKESGIEQRTHGNKGKRAPNALPYQVIENVVTYIRNFADENGLPMPAAPRGRNEIPRSISQHMKQKTRFINAM